MSEENCAFHDVSIRSAETQDPNMLLEYRGSERCPETEDCEEICETARKYRHHFDAFRRNESVPEGESPAELWTRLVYLAQVERVNRSGPPEPAT